MKSNCSYLAAFLITLGGLSCGEHTPQPTVYNIEQHMKDWIFFDTGSWWVYRETGSGITDSQYVTESSISYGKLAPYRKKHPYVKSQFAIVKLNSLTYFELHSPHGSSLVFKTDPWDSVQRGWTKLLYKPFQPGIREASHGPYGYTEITALNPHFTLDNITFDTLLTVFDNLDNSEGNDSMEYKVFKGVGIISKRNISKKLEWKLIRYHINLNKG
jgi:hypothetical protein